MGTTGGGKNTGKGFRHAISKSIAVLSLVMLSIMNALAYDFENDGIFYNIISETDRTVEMASPYHDGWEHDSDPKRYGKYNDDVLELPPTVNYNGTEYTVVRLGKYVFGYARPKKFIMPETISTIGKNVFRYSPREVVLPNSIRVIEEGAFSESDLCKINFPEGLVDIGAWAFWKCANLDSIVIPESIQTIGSYAFNNSGLKCVKFPESLTILGEGWVANTPLTIVELSSRLQEINGTFMGCDSLKSIELPETLTKLSYGAFQNCKNLRITLPESLQYIGKRAFDGVPFYSVTIPRNVSKIEESAFNDVKEKFIVADDNRHFTTHEGMLLTIGMDTLLSISRNNLDIVVPEGVRRIGEEAFIYYGGEKVKLPSTLRELGVWCFQESKITSINIPEGVKKIPADAFLGCAELSSVVIPSSVDTVGSAFTETWWFDEDGMHHPCGDYPPLKTVYSLNPVPPVASSSVFENCYNTTLYVPIGSAEAYRKADGWGAFNYAEDSIREIDFSGVEAVAPDEIGIRIDGNTIIISGKPEDCPVELYDMTGRLVHQGLAPSIPDLTPGIFILKVASITKKIAVK